MASSSSITKNIPSIFRFYYSLQANIMKTPFFSFHIFGNGFTWHNEKFYLLTSFSNIYQDINMCVTFYLF